MERLLAVLGDIHANIDALRVVLDDCRAQGVTDFLCTGDVVGYNACPHECLEIIRGLGCPVVMGNHDHYVSSRQNLDDFNENAKVVIEWTRHNISPTELMYLRGLPFTVAKMGIMLVHATLDNPESFGYVFELGAAKASFPFQTAPICFHGHTHCPVIFEKQIGDSFQIDAQNITLRIGRKYFINVGSVGQPRDGDPRATYVLYNPKTRDIRFRRLEYDIEAAQGRILAAGLPAHLAQRLAVGR